MSNKTKDRLLTLACWVMLAAVASVGALAVYVCVFFASQQ